MNIGIDDTSLIEFENDMNRCKRAKSLVEVFFPDRGQSYTYYNDRFDLHMGDHVWVEGRLEKCVGVVVKVITNFKIKLSDYKRVISLIDTCVHGELFLGGSHLITFDRYVLSKEQIHSWFFAPKRDDEEEYVVGNDENTVYHLDDLSSIEVDSKVVERGLDYYKNDHVKYVCVDHGYGYAIVKGNRYYEVEFDLEDRKVSNLVCDCFCHDVCKHEVAVLLQLKETLERILEHYDVWYDDYFAAIDHTTLMCYAVGTKQKGRITLRV